VPNVVGRSEDTAKALLSNEGFNVNVETVEQPGGTPGEVVDQDPKGKQKKPRGSDVTITVIAQPDPNPDPSDGDPDPDDTTPPGGGGGTEDGDGLDGILRP
jgi:serine/threonine-protein kinase